jgi:hypothetical protein
VLLGDFGVAGYTLEYAAPELVGGGERSKATDLWAAAVTFYELISGGPAFGQRPDLTDAELADRIAQSSYIHPDERLPYLPLRFRSFFRGCFVPDPRDRAFPTAAAMRAALRELAVKVEWVRVAKDWAIVRYEGYAVTGDGNQTGVMYEASVVERPRKRDFVAEIKKAEPGGNLRRLRGLAPVSGSKAQAGQKLSVWMRTLTENGDIPR